MNENNHQIAVEIRVVSLALQKLARLIDDSADVLAAEDFKLDAEPEPAAAAKPEATRKRYHIRKGKLVKFKGCAPQFLKSSQIEDMLGLSHSLFSRFWEEDDKQNLVKLINDRKTRGKVLDWIKIYHTDGTVWTIDSNGNFKEDKK